MMTFLAVLTGLSPWMLFGYVIFVRWMRLKGREQRYVSR